MRNSIQGLEEFEGEVKTFNKEAGALKIQGGAGLVSAVESWYAIWKSKHTKRARREYMTWRLRLHLKHNDNPNLLEKLNDTFDLGLYDTEVGPTYWSIEQEKNVGFTQGFNWRKDSGNALRGGSAAEIRTVRKDMEEQDEEA